MYAVYVGGSGDISSQEAYTHISPYFTGDYFTGQWPPVNINFTPYSGVVDLETMKVMWAATFFNPGNPQQILDLVKQANSD